MSFKIGDIVWRIERDKWFENIDIVEITKIPENTATSFKCLNGINTSCCPFSSPEFYKVLFNKNSASEEQLNIIKLLSSVIKEDRYYGLSILKEL